MHHLHYYLHVVVLSDKMASELPQQRQQQLNATVHAVAFDVIERRHNAVVVVLALQIVDETMRIVMRQLVDNAIDRCLIDDETVRVATHTSCVVDRSMVRARSVLAVRLAVAC